MSQLERFAKCTPAARGVDSVVARMRELAASWPAWDGVAVFNRVYLSVTEEVDRHIDGGPVRRP